MPKQAKETSTPVAAPVVTEMSDGRQVTFGRRKALYNVANEEPVVLTGAFSDGEYRSFTMDPASLVEWAAYGLRQFAKSLNLETSAAFDAKQAAFVAGPNAVAPRSSSGTAPTPIEQALRDVTAQTLEKVRAFLAPLSRKQVNALKADPRIAPVYAGYQAALLASRSASKVSPEAPAPVDLLAGLAETPTE